jgi:hypothetical protein
MRKLGRTAVYVIEMDGAGYVKVGIANSPLNRLAWMQTSSPFPLKLHFQHALRCRDDAREIEVFTHDELIGKWRRGEWFSCTPEEAIAAFHRALFRFVVARRAQVAA